MYEFEETELTHGAMHGHAQVSFRASDRLCYMRGRGVEGGTGKVPQDRGADPPHLGILCPSSTLSVAHEYRQ